MVGAGRRPRRLFRGHHRPGRPVPALVADLQRDARLLGELVAGGFPLLVDAELNRLIDRHLPETARGSGAAHRLAAALRTAGMGETASGFDPVPAARVAMFLATEAR